MFPSSSVSESTLKKTGYWNHKCNRLYLILKNIILYSYLEKWQSYDTNKLKLKTDHAKLDPFSSS